MTKKSAAAQTREPPSLGSGPAWGSSEAHYRAETWADLSDTVGSVWTLPDSGPSVGKW